MWIICRCFNQFTALYRLVYVQALCYAPIGTNPSAQSDAKTPIIVQAQGVCRLYTYTHPECGIDKHLSMQLLVLYYYQFIIITVYLLLLIKVVFPIKLKYSHSLLHAYPSNNMSFTSSLLPKCYVIWEKFEIFNLLTL